MLHYILYISGCPSHTFRYGQPFEKIARYLFNKSRYGELFSCAKSLQASPGPDFCPVHHSFSVFGKPPGDGKWPSCFLHRLNLRGQLGKEVTQRSAIVKTCASTFKNSLDESHWIWKVEPIKTNGSGPHFFWQKLVATLWIYANTWHLFRCGLASQCRITPLIFVLCSAGRQPMGKTMWKWEGRSASGTYM